MTHGAEASQADIKRYEEILSADPASYCFAPLAELYRKAGLLDDAIATARKGIGLHPDYVGGYMALGRACFDKGEQKESREALERVVKATPDNLVAQKLLGRIYEESGETGLVRKTLETILLLNPDDHESRAALDALDVHERSFDLGSDIFTDEEPIAEEAADLFDDESLLEEVEIIEELDDEVLNEELEAAEESRGKNAPQIFDEAAPREESDAEPLSTATIAELYIKQGFLKKALKIYRDLLDANPGNEALRQSIVDLKHRIDEDEASARENAFTSKMPFGDEFAEASNENGIAAGLPAADVVARLEEWLDTIGRARQCRSGRL